MLSLAEYIVGTFGASHYVVSTGVKEVVARLSAPLQPSHIHLSSAITSMTPSPKSSSLTLLQFSSTEPPILFSHVVLATQANQAASLLRLLRDTLPSANDRKAEQERIDALGAFEYAPCLVVNHRDESLLPTNLRDRRDLNLTSFPALSPTSLSGPGGKGTEHTLPPTAIQSTHILSRTHPHLGTGSSLLQTTNPIVRVDPMLVLSETWYERAKVTQRSKAVLPRFMLDNLKTKSPKGKLGLRRGDLQGQRGVYFVGSWCAEGIPLLEGCVQSAERVVSAIAKAEGAEVSIPF
ncbi:hypothetical protein P7C70_g4255, partial [Phenoliferia sp. Uapishka_3]